MLDIRDLTVVRGGRTVLESLSFSLQPGEGLLLTGRNGVGKSTLLRALAGLLPLRAGAVHWGGTSVADEPERYRAALSYIGHRDGLKSGWTPFETLSHAIRIRGERPVSAQIDDALEEVGLGPLADMPVRLFSAGQRRRLVLAHAIAADSRLWLLDEPTTALDREGVGRFEEMLAAHLAAGGMCIAATHLPIGGGHRELRLGAAEPLPC